MLHSHNKKEINILSNTKSFGEFKIHYENCLPIMYRKNHYCECLQHITLNGEMLKLFSLKSRKRKTTVTTSTKMV